MNHAEAKASILSASSYAPRPPPRPTLLLGQNTWQRQCGTARAAMRTELPDYADDAARRYHATVIIHRRHTTDRSAGSASPPGARAAGRVGSSPATRIDAPDFRCRHAHRHSGRHLPKQVPRPVSTGTQRGEQVLAAVMPAMRRARRRRDDHSLGGGSGIGKQRLGRACGPKHLTRADDLTQLFRRHGHVSRPSVFHNARIRPGRHLPKKQLHPDPTPG